MRRWRGATLLVLVAVVFHNIIVSYFPAAGKGASPAVTGVTERGAHPAIPAATPEAASERREDSGPSRQPDHRTASHGTAPSRAQRRVVVSHVPRRPSETAGGPRAAPQDQGLPTTGRRDAAHR
ncbi:hypothetical protein GCM10009675_02070 [Prauserella alba]|uniref:Uncharacterized protein n=1 Tax=Prauserella alba TaxID=176898 RepID=A0ABP4FPG7_9PSEU